MRGYKQDAHWHDGAYTPSDKRPMNQTSKMGLPIHGLTNSSADQEQVGGDHYKDMAIQPALYVHKNGIGYCEGSAIAYLSRWRSKGGIEDLLKAKHFIDLLIQMEDLDGQS